MPGSWFLTESEWIPPGTLSVSVLPTLLDRLVISDNFTKNLCILRVLTTDNIFLLSDCASSREVLELSNILLNRTEVIDEPARAVSPPVVDHRAFLQPSLTEDKQPVLWQNEMNEKGSCPGSSEETTGRELE
ncbi:hypothetical protein RUM44_006601 [Polyplax serrata]|uniref:Uncharacterized protein n=1 Tax=Polyplax serrata TaxID=468196 RepID=A0ABR1AJA0_POLSC